MKNYFWYTLICYPKAFDSINRGMMERIQLTYSLPKETVTAIMMFFKNTKAVVRVSDGSHIFNIVPGVLQRDTLVTYLFIIYRDYVLWMPIYLIKENGFTFKKQKKGWWYPVETMTDKLNRQSTLFANTPAAQTEFLLYSQGQIAESISLHANANKTSLWV